MGLLCSVMLTTPIDITRIRDDFPALTHGLAFFDGPGGTQTPVQVAEAISATLTGPLSNRGTDSLPQLNANNAVLAFRAAMADFLDAEPEGVIYGRSATALTFDMSRTLAKDWQPGDEIIVTRLDHDCNIRPWVIAAESAGAVVRWADFEVETGELPVGAITDLLSERTKLVAVTGASNLIGTMPDLSGIAEVAHGKGALVYVDAVHAAAHTLLSLKQLGVDFLVCSPYKFLGPHCGVLVADPQLLAQLSPDKLLPSKNDVPERFEHGTLPYEIMAGATAAVDYLAGIVPQAAGTRRERLAASYAAIHEHETRLRERIERVTAELPGVTSWSRAQQRTPTMLFTFAGHSAAEVAARLLEAGVSAPAGSFYAYEAAQLLGLGTPGGLRIGLAPYNSDEDVDRLLEVLTEL